MTTTNMPVGEPANIVQRLYQIQALWSTLTRANRALNIREWDCGDVQYALRVGRMTGLAEAYALIAGVSLDKVYDALNIGD